MRVGASANSSQAQAVEGFHPSKDVDNWHATLGKASF